MFGIYNYIDSSVRVGKDNVSRTTLYLHDVEKHQVDSYTVEFPVPAFDYGEPVICDLDLVRTRDSAYVFLKSIAKSKNVKEGK